MIKMNKDLYKINLIKELIYINIVLLTFNQSVPSLGICNHGGFPKCQLLGGHQKPKIRSKKRINPNFTKIYSKINVNLKNMCPKTFFAPNTTST